MFRLSYSLMATCRGTCIFYHPFLRFGDKTLCRSTAYSPPCQEAHLKGTLQAFAPAVPLKVTVQYDPQEVDDDMTDTIHFPRSPKPEGKARRGAATWQGGDTAQGRVEIRACSLQPPSRRPFAHPPSGRGTLREWGKLGTNP